MASKCEEDLWLSSRPVIIQSHGENRDTHTLIDPLHGIRHETSCPDMEGKLCFGSIGTHLLLFDQKTDECFFLDRLSMSKILLPPMPIPFYMLRNLSVSSSLACPDCVVILTGFTMNFTDPSELPENLIFFCRPNDEKWTKISVDLNYQGLFCGSGIVHQGKLYVIINGGAIVVMDVPSLIHDGNTEMEIIQPPEAPRYPNVTSGNLCIVESLGDIFMVRIRDSNGTIVYVDVHRLKISSEQVWDRVDHSVDDEIWERVDSIGDRAFFLEEKGCMSVRAKDVEMECNCIYVIQTSNGEERLYKICLDDRTFTFNLLSEKMDYSNTICWLMPSRCESIIESCSESSKIASNEVSNEKFRIITEDGIETNKADVCVQWADFPIDLFEFVLPQLSLVDAVRLRAVCTAWKSIHNPFTQVETWPWLIYQAKIDGTYRFFDPLYEKEYMIKIERLSLNDQDDRVLLLCSKNGWIIALIDDWELIMINPFFPENSISSPPLLDGHNFHGIVFTSVPTCSDCIVFGFASYPATIEISLWKPWLNEENWDIITFPDEVDFKLAGTNPVFINGDFYCLGENGELGVFNLENRTWKVVNNPEPIYCASETIKCHLLEFKGELCCVIKEKNGRETHIRTFMFDRTKMVWGKLEDLGDVTIFLESRSSLAKSLPHKSHVNKIFSMAYDPAQNNKCAFYCMKKKINNMEPYNLKEPINCVWLEPNMQN